MDRQGQWDEPKGQQSMDVQSTLTHQTELNAASTGRDSSTAPKSVFSTERFAIQYVVNGAENIGHWGGVIVAICTSHGIRLEGAISTQLLPVHLWDGPAAGFSAAGQYPPAHSPRRLHPRVLPLLLGQVGSTAGEAT